VDTGVTVEEMQSFEKEVFELFKNAQIRSPIHLRGGNEEQLIEIFKDIREQDFCFFTWASHLECLLKGVPRDELRQAILNNKSICLSFKKYHIISSAIVGGNAPLATGMAMGFKRSGVDRKVWCFVGDMAFYTGTVLESIRYAEVHDLPITFVVADNKVSVTTPTREIWGNDIETITANSPKCIRYEYTNIYPHAGTGEKVLF
tara:strand:+ start:184 stop:792 length:609 start_codon:yes stop_codon:yes gene_type:complete